MSLSTILSFDLKPLHYRHAIVSPIKYALIIYANARAVITSMKHFVVIPFFQTKFLKQLK